MAFFIQHISLGFGRALILGMVVVFLDAAAHAADLARVEAANIEGLDTPPPDALFMAAKVDPASYHWSVGAELGWGFANPFADDYALGLTLAYLPTSWLRTMVIFAKHGSRDSRLAATLDDHLSIDERRLHLNHPDWDVLAAAELRALHGLVRAFSRHTLDYEVGIFFRTGLRTFSDSGVGPAWVFAPGVSHTVLVSPRWSVRLSLSADLKAGNDRFGLQNVYLQGGAEYRW